MKKINSEKMVEYERRFCVFIDILGFKALVDKSLEDSEVLNALLGTLDNFSSKNIVKDLFGSINISEDHKDYEGAVEMQEFISTNYKKSYDIKTTYFSDCLVLSCNPEKEEGVFIIFDKIALLFINLFEKFNILIRGGCAIDKLIHQEGGIILGPALVKSYELESKFADTPRIISDDIIKNATVKGKSYSNMSNLFHSYSDDYFGISLASSYEYSFTQNSRNLMSFAEVYESFEISLCKTKELKEKYNGSKLQKKYDFLYDEMNKVKDRYPPPTEDIRKYSL